MPQVNTDMPTALIISPKVIVPYADILLLPTIQYPILAAPGVGFRIYPLFALMSLKQTVAYTNLDISTIAQLKYPNSSTSFISNGSAKVALQKTANFQLSLGSISLIGNDDVDCNNQGMFLKFDNGAAGNLTGGIAGQRLEVIVGYTILPVS